MDPILAYLEKDELLDDRKEADRIRRIATNIGSQRMGTYTNDHTQGLTYSVYTRTPFRACFGKSTKECVEDMLEEYP